ncbi:MAG: hypothetical protein RQ885_13725 [Desulfurococcales archaeon]|jgi:hypothetical protein|nr:hypothetical protein [Desulfurococcales archaeon]
MKRDTVRRVPTRDPDSLEAFKKQIEKRKRSRRRTNRVALFSNRYEEALFDIGLACARLWNEPNYEKRRHSSIESYRLRRGI